MSGAWHFSHSAVKVSLNVGNTKGQIHIEEPPLTAPTHQQNPWNLITGCWQRAGEVYQFACSSHSVNPFEHHEEGLPVCVCSESTCRQRRKEPQLCDCSARCFGCEVLSGGAGAGSAGKQMEWDAMRPNASLAPPSVEGNPRTWFIQGPYVLLPPRCSAQGSDVKRTESKSQTSHNRQTSPAGFLHGSGKGCHVLC